MSRNFVKSKMCKTNCNFEKFQNPLNLIYTACAMLEMMIKTMFAIVSMMCITGVEISQKPNVQNKLQFRKVWKHYKSDIHCVFNIGNDDLNYVCNSWHHAHHRSRYFESAKMRKTSSNFEKFENTVNLLYTVWAILEMII